jgi:dolichol-phosphate mannosyltransferase
MQVNGYPTALEDRTVTSPDQPHESVESKADVATPSAAVPVQRTPAAPVATPVKVLYDEPVEPSAHNRVRTVRQSGTGYLPYRYDVAGLVSVGSQIELPELECFREPTLGRGLDIEVRVGKVGASSPRRRAQMLRFSTPNGLRYEEHLGRLGANFAIDFESRILVTVSGLLARSPHVAYTNVIEALLRFSIAAKGGMLLHSACIEVDGVGMLLSARTDTGKTGTVLRLLRDHRATFLSDDMTVVFPDGTARSFPKPMTISSHTLRAVDPGDLSRREWWALAVQSRLHSKGGRGIGMLLGELNLPVMTANAITQMIIPPPKYVAERLVDAESKRETAISEIFIIERGAPALIDVDTPLAIEELLANTEDAYGFPPFRYLAPELNIGGQGLDGLRAREEGVLESLLANVRVRRLTSDTFGWADEIPTLVGPGSAAQGHTE